MGSNNKQLFIILVGLSVYPVSTGSTKVILMNVLLFRSSDTLTIIRVMI